MGNKSRERLLENHEGPILVYLRYAVTDVHQDMTQKTPVVIHFRGLLFVSLVVLVNFAQCIYALSQCWHGVDS